MKTARILYIIAAIFITLTVKLLFFTPYSTQQAVIKEMFVKEYSTFNGSDTMKAAIAADRLKIPFEACIHLPDSLRVAPIQVVYDSETWYYVKNDSIILKQLRQ